MQNISEQLEELERTKKEYIAKNHQQVRCILFVSASPNTKNTIVWKMERKPDPLGKDLAKLLNVIFNLQSKVIRNFQSQVNSLQSELHTLARAQVETAELLQQQEEDLERERKYSDELKKKLRVSNNLLTTVIVTTSKKIMT